MKVIDDEIVNTANHADFDWFDYEELPEEISVGGQISI